MGTLVPPGPLSAVQRREYRSAGHPREQAIAAFGLLDATGTTRAVFDTSRTALTIAGRLRDAVRRSALAAQWTDARIDASVLGDGATRGEPQLPVARRFAYWPAPTIEPRGPDRRGVIGSFHRVVVTSFDEASAGDIEWARRALSGQDLVDEDTGRPVALISAIPHDSVIRRYTAAASSWATTTPVVLPGYDDPKHYRRRLRDGVTAVEQTSLLRRLDDRIDGLLRKAMVQAGIDDALAARADVTWNVAGFWPGCDRADRSGVPDHLKRFPRYHVAVTWRDPQGKPVALTGPFVSALAATMAWDYWPARNENRVRAVKLS